MKDWRFERALNNETNKYESNYEIVFSTPVRQTLTNAPVHCADATAATAVQIASNHKSGYCNAVQTMVYEQKFIIHCWQYADPWEKKEHVPTSVGVRLTINMPFVRIPCNCLDFTPNININDILESIDPFKDMPHPYKLESIDITVYLFVDEDPVISTEYALRGPATYGNLIDNRTNRNWTTDRDNEVATMKNIIMARYDDSKMPENMMDAITCSITNPFLMTAELKKIQTDYPELYKWYCDYIDARRVELAKKYPNFYKDSLKQATKYRFGTGSVPDGIVGDMEDTDND